MSMLKVSNREQIGSGALFLILGILMCVWPVGTAGVMCMAAGVVMLAVGAWRAVGYFRKKEFGLNDRLDFAAAALLLVIGLLLIVKPDAFIAMVPFIIGMIILVNSVFQIQTAMELKRIGYDRWWYHLTAALVCGAIALVMMFDPFASYRIMSAIMGAAFIADGAAELWTAIYLKKQLKKLGLL